MLGPNFTGLGKRPDLIPFHHVDLPTGISESTAGKRIKPVSGNNIFKPYNTEDGGEEGIRTLDTVSRIHAFQAGAINHSATSPK